MAFLITYIPLNPSERNEKLIQRVKRYDTWAILNATNYIVKSKGKTPVDIRTELVDCINSKDKLMISELSGNAAWRSFSPELSEWLKRNL